MVDAGISLALVCCRGGDGVVCACLCCCVAASVSVVMVVVVVVVVVLMRLLQHADVDGVILK